MRDRPSSTHRNVASKASGGTIPRGTDVHHKDDNKANNAPGNLEQMSHSAHSSHTGKTRGLRKLRHALTMHERKEKLY